MDNSMPNWADDFDFGAFLNLPPDDVDQGVEDGHVDLNSLGSNCSGHSPTAWTWDESGHGSDSMPNLCDERRLDVPWPSHGPTLLDPSENAEALQSTNFQLQTNNASPGFGYGASNYEIGASGYVRPASATVLKTTGSRTIAMGDCGEVCTIPSEQESSPPFTPDPASHEASGNQCACISCLKIHLPYGRYSRSSSEELKCRFPSCFDSRSRSLGWWRISPQEQSHYGLPGKYTCLEQNCQASTKHFGDLGRHYKNKHCTSPDKEQFPCPVPWCKYSGNNGFARKDKLKSHYKNIHEGKPGPVKAGRVIKPATLKPRVSSFGNNPGKQNE